MKESITYFENMGKVNTEEALRISRERAVKGGIKTIVMASSSGFTANRALEIFDGVDVSFVVVGTRKASFPKETAERLEKMGHRILFPEDHDFSYPALGHEVLRRFCEGMKVCVQIVLMATDAGLIPTGREVIAVAGTGTIEFEGGGGADTALIVQAVKSKDFYNPELPVSQVKREGRKIKEILCKPR